MTTEVLRAPCPQQVSSDVPPDAELLRRFVQKRDREALGELFLRHADAAFRLARRISGNAADAEESVQSAFVNIMQRATQYDGTSTVKGWLMSIVANVTRDRMRQDAARCARQEIAGEGGNKPCACLPEAREHLSEALEQLPDLYRMPVYLHYLEGLSFAEVATTLEIPERTVRTQVSRGVERLRESLRSAGYAYEAPALIALLATVPLETAPAALTVSVKVLAAAGALPAAATATVAAKTAGTVLSAKMLGLTAAAVFSVAAIVHTALPAGRSGPIGGEYSAEETPPEKAGAFANASPEVLAALEKKLDAVYRRDSVGEVLIDLKRRTGLRSAIPASSGNDMRYVSDRPSVVDATFAFSYEAKDVTARQVVERLVKEAGLDVDCRGDTLVLWKKADDALLKKLTETAKADVAGERREAVRELGTLWDRRIYPALFAAVDDREDDVVQAALSALRAHAKTLRYADNLAQGATAILKQWEKARPQQANPHSGISGREMDLMTLASATGDKRVVEALLPVFRDVNTMRASCAMGALTDFDDPRPISAAIELQKGGDQSVKFAALRLLYGSKDPNAQAAFEEAVKGGGWVEKSCAVGACMAATPPKMDTLLELLKNGDFQTRRSALYSLSTVYDPRLIDMLLEWSRQGDKNQYHAINVLGTYREERVVTGLLALLNTGGVRVQASLATALGKLADPRAVEPLAALTKSAESGVAKAALGGLIRIGDAKAEEVLLGMLRDPQTRQTVAQSLATERLADSIVAKALKDCDAPTRICLIRELGNSRKQVWLPAVADCLKDADPEVKRTAQIALGRLYSGSAAAAVFSSMLKDPDPRVRVHLADVLSLAYDTSAIEMLNTLLKDADPEVRLAAVGALGSVGALTEARAKRLNEPKPDGMMGMMHGFPQMDIGRIRTLITALSDADPRVQAGAAEAIGNAYVNGKQELIRPMLKDAKPRVRELALKALGSASEDEDFAPVLTLLTDTDAAVAAAAAEALAKVRVTKPEAVMAVQALLKFDKEAVRLAAIKCLGLSFIPEAVDAAIAVLDEPDGKMRKCAIEVLAPSWNPKSVAAVTRFLKDPDEGLRSAAFDGLMRSNCDAAVDALIALLTDNDPKLRETTAVALKKRLDEHQKTKGAVYPGDDKIKQALDRMNEKPNAGEF